MTRKQAYDYAMMYARGHTLLTGHEIEFAADYADVWAGSPAPWTASQFFHTYY